MFSSKQEPSAGDSASFHSTVASNQLPVAMPVEIAEDISKINSGIQPSNSWQPTADKSEAAQASTDSPVEKVASPDQAASVAGAVDQPRLTASKAAGGKTQTYTVKNGDTLMKISFENFGNVYRWREIYDANRERIGNFNALVTGTVLTIHGVEYILITKNGKSYFIRRNDTLVKISRRLYGSPAYWRDIWDNNRQLIHNPNKIYAGFTLYYREKPGVDQPISLSSAKQTAAPTDTQIPSAVNVSAAQQPLEQALIPTVPSAETSSKRVPASPEK